MLKKTHALIISSLTTLFFMLSIFVIIPFSTVHAADITRSIMFPVNGPSSFRDDFAEPRGATGTREHLGVDIIANKMTQAVSAVDGEVVYVVSPEASWGYAVFIQDSEGYTYRYLHLNNDTPGTDDGNGGLVNAYAPGIQRGVRVQKGQHIGWVGDSGNAENTVSHLHFEIRQPGGIATNPYPSLVAAAAASQFSASIRVGTAMIIDHPSDSSMPMVDSKYFFATDLSVGSRGEAVSQLQTKLKALGYFTSYVTDYFGPITESAVIKYQMAKGLSPNGIVGFATRNALNEGLTAPVITPVAQPSSAALNQNLSVGSQGEPVRQLQILLKSLGYFQNSVTGYFGLITKAAVIKFQIAKRISPTGVVERITRAFLDGCTSNSGYATRTGKSCAGTLSTGCTSTVGYSTTTGQSCGTALLPGCTSNIGYSTTTGKSCWNI